jgi:hypothetical protein
VGSRAIALQISTICCSPGESLPTGVSIGSRPGNAAAKRDRTASARRRIAAGRRSPAVEGSHPSEMLAATDRSGIRLSSW